jgi:two-component sensor histidine kinase
VTLDPHRALVLSMVLHELATNAAKYGALSEERGRIEIDWTLADDDGAAELRISWRERDGPTVAPPRRRGFGLTMIERSLGAEPGSAVGLDFAPEGLRCAIRLILTSDAVAVPRELRRG